MPVHPMDNIDYCLKLDGFRKSDEEREQLMRDLVARYADLRAEHQNKLDDLENEVTSRRILKRERDAAKAQIEAAHLAGRAEVEALRVELETLRLEVKLSQDSDAMVGVFIDGDGYVFPEELIKKGEKGGEEAAYILLTSIKKTLKEYYPGVHTDSWHIIVHVALHMSGLGKTLKNAGEVTFYSKELPAFAVGFNHGAQLTCEMYDVGEGKERADVKLRKVVETMLPHCKHIFFGGCHDTGYASWLEQYKHDQKIAPRFTLLMNGAPHDRIASLNFKMANYSHIFRPNPGNDNPRFSATAPPSRQPRQNSLAPFSHDGGESATSVGMSTPGTGPASPVLNSGSAMIAPFPPPLVPPTPAPSVEAASGGGGSGSWAALGKTGPKVIDIAPKKPTAKPHYYLINQDSERLDKPLPKFDSGASMRFNDKIKRQGSKFCNMYHLVGPSACPVGDNCKHEHGERLPHAELLVLQNIARTMPCGKRPGCDNVHCPYTHACVYGKKCEKDYSCKLSDTHHYNLRPAMKVYEGGRYEPITEGNY